MKYLILGGVTEVGYLHQEPSLTVGQEVWERVKMAWEGWRKWWLGKGNLLASSRAYLGLPVHVWGWCTLSVLCPPQGCV